MKKYLVGCRLINTVKNLYVASLYFLLMIGCGAGCGAEKDIVVRGKLRIILDDDLKAIVEGLPKESLADSVFYRIIKYKTYEEGPFYALAIVEFYFLKNIKYKIVRKYRYDRRKRLWDRFFNVYQYYCDSLSKYSE